MESYEDFSTRAESLRDRWNKLLSGPDKFSIYNLVVAKLRELESKYPNARDYLAFHILAGSTPHHELPHLDFPGEDSLENFLTQFENAG